MSGVDNRIVSMEFDNASFERKLGTTLASLDKLQKSLLLSQGAKGFENVNAAANRVDLSHIANAVDHISGRFSAMGAVGFSVIQNLTSSALDFAKRIGGDILAPILGGGKSRAGNIEQAKFMFRGLGIDVEQGMQSALDAVRGTAFGLDQAAKAAAQFGASGIKVGKEMTGALRGVAGAAAMTGSSFTEIADIFAGSAGSGKVTNQDLMQFATRGLNAAAAVGKVMGKTEAQIHEMATAGTLDFKTFADAMDKAFGKHATEANQTYAGALANLHAALSRVGASFFGPQEEQQRDLFNALTPVIDNVAKALQPLITAFLDVRRIGIDKIIGFINKIDLTNFTAGITNLSTAFRDAFAFIRQFIGLVSGVFREIFPPSDESLFLAITVAIKNFFEKLKMGAETTEKIKSIFRGFFAAIEIGWTIIETLIGLLKELFQAIFPATAGILTVGASVGDMLTRLNERLVAGGGIRDFFIKLREVVVAPIKFIQELKDKIVDFFTIDTGKEVVTGTVDRIGQRVDMVSSAWDRMQADFIGVKAVLDKTLKLITDWFSSLGKKIANAFQPGDFDAAVDVINVGLLGSLILIFKKILGGNLMVDLTGGVLDKIRIGFGQLTNTLKAMQFQLKAQALLKIAAAIGIMTLSMIALSLVDSAALTKALTAIGVGFGMLVGVMTLMDKIVSKKGSAAKIAVVSGAMIAMATAIDILSIAIKVLSTLSPGELATGLAGIGVGLGILVLAANLLSANAVSVLAGSAAMVAMATALNILAGAIKIFATMSWSEIGKGLGTVAAGLILITTAMNLMPPSSVLSGLGFIEIATGLSILAGAVKLFSMMSWTEMAKGMAGIGAGLLIIAGAMNLMPLNLPITAAGILILSNALIIMAGAVKLMGSTDMNELAKGIGAFAAMLIIIAAAMKIMDTSLSGAAALVIIAGALLILTHVLKELAALKISEILKGLGAMAGLFLVLGAAAFLLEPLIPVLVGLGGALALVGGAFALFGLGVSLIGKGFEILAKSGAKGAKALVDIIKVFVTAKFEIAKALAAVIFSFAEELLKGIPLMVRLMEALMLQLLETVIKLVPEIAKAIATIVVHALILMRALFPLVLQVGIDMLLEFLRGLKEHAGEIVTSAVDMITAFVTAINDNMSRIVDAAFALMAAFMFEVGNHILELVGLGFSILTNIILGITENLFKIVELAGTIITLFITEIGRWAVRIGEAGAKALIAFLNGIQTNTAEVIKKGIAVAVAFISSIALGVLTLTNEIAKVLVNFLNGMATAIRTHAKEIHDAGMNLADAIIDGVIIGITGKKNTGRTKDALVGFAKGALGVLGGPLGFALGSPSKKTLEMGKQLVAGLVLALKQDTTFANNAAAFSEKSLTRMQEALNSIPDSLAGMEEFNPTIRPVLDLTNVQKASVGIQNLLKLAKISPEVSFDVARFVSNTTDLSRLDDRPPTPPVPTEVKFEQNIYSPSSLDTNSIYRSTKSQIVLAKEELGI